MRTKANKNTIKKQFWLTKVVEKLVADLKDTQLDLIIADQFVEIKQTAAAKPLRKQKEAKVKQDLFEAFIKENEKAAIRYGELRDIAANHAKHLKGKIKETTVFPLFDIEDDANCIYLYDTCGFDTRSCLFQTFDYKAFEAYLVNKLAAMEQVLILMIATCSKPQRIDKRRHFRKIIKFLFKNLDDSHSKANSFSTSFSNYLDFTKHESNLYRCAC